MARLDCEFRPKLLVVTNPENRRYSFLQRAAAKTGWDVECIAYKDLLLGNVSVDEINQSADAVRLDSPGENYEVERLLLARGAPVAEEQNLPHLSPKQLAALSDELGRIHYPFQYFLGFCDLLESLERSRPSARWMNSPSSIRKMFHKPETSALLRQNGIATPVSFGRVESFEQILSIMVKNNCTRVFLKLATSSSASGVIALYFSGGRVMATTTVELVSDRGEVKLYNSLRLKHLRDHASIEQLVRQLTPHYLLAEQWVPKAAYDHRTTFDLRIVTIDGSPTHFIPRVSSSPMTNLHLGNKRGDWGQVQKRLGDSESELTSLCTHAASVFTEALYAGLDVVISPSLRSFCVLEMNACGDLLPNVLDRAGDDTYTAELSRLKAKIVDSTSCLRDPS